MSVAAVIWDDIKMAGKRTNQADVVVRGRIGAFRKEANLSQNELANEIGITFQQVQKYENGINRVGASRLTKTAHALDVSIIAFFEGLAHRTDKRRDVSARLIELESMPAAPKLLKAFSEMFHPVIQTDIIKLVRALSDR